MQSKPKTLAMILAGGRVDELDVLTLYRPKSAVPFGGFARVIDFALSNLMNSGLERVAILSQYRNFSLINHIGTGAAWDMIGRHRGISILPPFKGYDKSHWYRGSADAVYQNLDYIQHLDPAGVLILSGDHVYRMDYRDMIDYHWAKDADLTITCLKVPAAMAHRYGVVNIDDEDGGIGGRVTGYAEKPSSPQSDWASMTIYCFKPGVLREVLEANAREDDSFEFGRDIIPRLMGEGKRIYGYKFSGYWGYTRTVEEYWQANMDLLGASPLIRLSEWGLRTNLEHRNIRDCQPLKTGSAASICDSLIYNGCIVDGEVSNSVLFPGVHVKKGAVIKDSVLFFNNVVGENCRLSKVVSDVNTVYGPDVVVGGGAGCSGEEITVVGWHNAIPPSTVIGAGCTLYPRLRAEQVKAGVRAGEIVK